MDDKGKFSMDDKGKYCSHGSRIARALTHECHDCAREEIDRLRAELETAKRDREVVMAKKKITKTQPCPECRGRMAFKIKADRLEYKGHTKTLRAKGWWCDTCDEGILDGEALKASEVAFMKLKAEVDGILSPDERELTEEEAKLIADTAMGRIKGADDGE